MVGFTFKSSNNLEKLAEMRFLQGFRFLVMQLALCKVGVMQTV